MTVTAEDRFEVQITISVKNKATGEMVTETAHTDYDLNYGAMQAFRQVAVGSINEGTGKLGQKLAESFGQLNIGSLLGGAIDQAADKLGGRESGPGPGLIR